jgi:hypothetical protein
LAGPGMRRRARAAPAAEAVVRAAGRGPADVPEPNLFVAKFSTRMGETEGVLPAGIEGVRCLSAGPHARGCLGLDERVRWRAASRPTGARHRARLSAARVCANLSE